MTVSVSVIVPCYRSEETLAGLVDRTVGVLGNGVTTGAWTEYEVILVVDGSPDTTAAVARETAAKHDGVRVIELRRNYGQHNALVAGIREALHSVVVTMDDDLQHPPEEIPKLVTALRANRDVDLVYGVPAAEEHGRSRSLASRTVKLGLQAAGVANASLVGAFRAFRTHLRDGFEDVRDPNVNLDVILSWATSNVAGETVTMNRRASGKSNYSLRRLVKHALNMVTGYGTFPLRLASWLGFLCGVVGIVLLASVLIRYMTGETTVEGFTTLAAIISLFSGVQLFTIGIIGEYLGRAHFRGMNRPMYVVKND